MEANFRHLIITDALTLS